MKVALRIVAAFMSPLMLFSWVYALAKIAMYLWDWPPATAFFAAAIVTMTQMLFAYAADAAGLIEDRMGEKQ